MRSKPFGGLISEIDYSDLCVGYGNNMNISYAIIVVWIIFFYVIIGEPKRRLDIINNIKKSCSEPIMLG